MAENRADYTLTFRGLCDAAAGDEGPRGLFAEPAAFDAWERRWQQRLRQEETRPAERAAAMRGVNPRFIPRNHQVEFALQAATQRMDFQPFEELVAALSRPFDDADGRPGSERFVTPARPEERVLQTFCGT